MLVCVNSYDGRSVNKLQNSIILLIFKMWKFRNIRFVSNLILSTRCEFYFDDITVMSFINIRYCNIAVESILQGTTFCLFSVGKGLAHMWFTVRCVHAVYNDRCFTRPAIRVWCKKFARGRESVAVLFWRPMQRSQQSILLCGLTGMWWDKYLNEFGRYIEKWNVNVWRLNTFACWTCSLFSQLGCCLTQHVSCKRILLGNILHWLCSKYK